MTMAIGLFAANRHLSQGLSLAFQPPSVSGDDIAVFVAVFIVFTVLVVRFIRVGGAALRFAMAVAVYVGAQFVFAAFLQPPWPSTLAIVMAAAPVLSRQQYIRMAEMLSRLFPVLLIHNLAMVVSIAGISTLVGLSVTPTMAAFLLAILSFYDIYAVYHTKHMVRIAERMMAAGAVFGFLIPRKWHDFFSRQSQGQIMPRVMVLGSGDIGLPLVLASSAATLSMNAAIIIAVFASGGLGITHWLFTSQRKQAAMAALPPVAMAAIIGYVVAILLGV